MKHARNRRLWLIGGLATLACLASVQAWYGPGHDPATKAATAALPDDLPAFFRTGAETIAHCSADPDLFRLREQPELRDAEVPEHYFDLELLAGAPVPPTRYAFVKLCAGKGLRPEAVGLLPYAIVEWTQRLTLAFAEHRKWPANRHVRAKCLLYAGLLAHYAQDACQPLHTTIHYDGRVKEGGGSPRSLPTSRQAGGIHAKVDALLQKVKVGPEALAGRIRPAAFDKLMPAVVAEIKRSHALLDKVYELESQLPLAEAGLPADSKVARFAEERLGAAANFTASLFLTAWKNSARLALPDWHKRPIDLARPPVLEDRKREQS